MKTVLTIRSQLRAEMKKGDAPKGKFFKTGKGEYAEHDRFLGIKNPILRQLAIEHSTLPFDEIGELLSSAYNEERLLALLILVRQYKKSPDDVFAFYIDNLSSVNNWNLVDLSAHLIIGEHLKRRKRALLYKLAASTNMWDRRIAIVSTMAFIRIHEYDDTLALADILLNDNHDLIHKAVGWLLREVGKKDPQILRTFLSSRKSKMPRTMLRYAIERFNKGERTLLMSPSLKSRSAEP